MVRPVSLSDEAFARLRREKKPGESDSDVVLRLASEAQRARKDPDAFVRWKPKRAMTVEEQYRMIADFNAADQL